MYDDPESTRMAKDIAASSGGVLGCIGRNLLLTVSGEYEKDSGRNPADSGFSTADFSGCTETDQPTQGNSGGFESHDSEHRCGDERDQCHDDGHASGDCSGGRDSQHHREDDAEGTRRDSSSDSKFASLDYQFKQISGDSQHNTGGLIQEHQRGSVGSGASSSANTERSGNFTTSDSSNDTVDEEHFGHDGAREWDNRGYAVRDSQVCVPTAATVVRQIHYQSGQNSVSHDNDSINQVGDTMSLSLEFKSIGHFFSAGFRDIANGLKNIILVANKSQAVAPEVEELVRVLAGPLGGEVADLSFSVLGEVAAIIQASNHSGTSVTVTLEQDVVERIKKASSMVESILTAIGGKKPN